MEIKIRKIRKKEITEALKIFDSLPKQFDKKDRDLVHQDLLKYLNSQSQTARVYIASNGKEIVACGGYSNEPEGQNVYDLFWFAVKKGYQNQGIGTKLLKFIEAKLHQIGANMLLVRTLNSRTNEAERFYKHHRYKKEAILSDYYGEGKDEAIYYKKLD